MHGHDRLGSRGDGRLDPRRVNVVSVGLDIHEHRPGACPPDRAGGGEEGVWGSDHFITWADIEGQQRQQEGIGARRAAHRVRRGAISGHLSLERGNFRPEHEHLAFQHLADDGLDLIADRLVLCPEIEGGNTDGIMRDAHRRTLL